MSADTRLSALIVNYNTGALAVGCVRSLQHEWRRAGRPPAALTIVVVDNASPQDQTEHLAELERLGVDVLRSSENAGYARGMNLAFARTRGGPDDVIAILNPDLHFLPGSVDTLLEYVLANRRCGAVDPRAFMDPGGTINLPRNLLPTLFDTPPYVRVVQR